MNYMDKSLTMFLGGALVVALIALLLIQGRSSGTFGSDATIVPATIATSSNIVVGTTASIAFATSSGCTNRVVTTYVQPVTLFFSDYKGQRPTKTTGQWQAGSSTVAYDAGLYGCGAMYMYGFADATAVTISEAR